MAASGELAKMLILAFADSETCESGGEFDAARLKGLQALRYPRASE